MYGAGATASEKRAAVEEKKLPLFRESIGVSTAPKKLWFAILIGFANVVSLGGPGEGRSISRPLVVPTPRRISELLSLLEFLDQVLLSSLSLLLALPTPCDPRSSQLLTPSSKLQTPSSGRKLLPTTLFGQLFASLSG